LVTIIQLQEEEEEKKLMDGTAAAAAAFLDKPAIREGGRMQRQNGQWRLIDQAKMNS
jgi:hypothetical protein